MNRIKSLFASMLGLAVFTSLASADVLYGNFGIQTGEVVRVESGATVFIKTSKGELGLPLAAITRAEIAQPAAYNNAVTALKDGKYRDAVDGLAPIVDRYAGLDVSWVQNAMFELAEAYLGIPATGRALQVINKFRTLYARSPLVEGLDVKVARIMIADGNCGEANKKLAAVLTAMFKKDFLTDVQEGIVAEALMLQGDCLMATGKTVDALDSYLKIITLFDLDAERTLEAKYKAGVAFEKLGNWKRAKGMYEDFLKSGTQAGYVADAKKRLAAISKDHPE
jgi:TolA-binding protein